MGLILMKNNQNPLFTSFVFWVILLYPILGIYGVGIPGWSIASILILVIGLLTIPRINWGRVRDIMPIWLILLILDAVIIHYLSSNEAVIPLSEIQVFLMFLVFFYYITTDNLGTFISKYKKMALICIVFFYIQFITYHLLNVRLNGIFLSLPIAITDDVSGWMARLDESNRFSSFFSEPAHFAYFLMPLIIVEVYKENKNWLFIGLMVLSVVLSMSGTGLLALVVTILAWYFSNIIRRSKRSIWYMVFVGSALIIGAGVFMKTEMAGELLERQSEMSIDYTGGSRSGFMRLWRGYYVYAEMPTSRKIIGLNNDDLLRQYEQRSLFSETFSSDTDRFYNGMGMLLTRQGLVGLFLFLVLLGSIWKKTNQAGKLIIICFFSYMLMESVYLNNRMALYLILSWCLLNNKKVVTIRKITINK